MSFSVGSPDSTSACAASPSISPVAGRVFHGRQVRIDGILHLAGLEQHLPLELVEIWVLRLDRDQLVHQRHGGLRLLRPVEREGTAVAARDGMIVLREFAQGDRGLQVSQQFCLHAVVALLHLRQILLVGGAPAVGRVLHRLDAVARQRVGAGILHGAVLRQRLLPRELVEKLVQTRSATCRCVRGR